MERGLAALARVDEAATPLDPEECNGLIPTHVTLRHELNDLEAANVLEGDLWAFRRKRKDLLTERFLLELHWRMFGRIWEWAGEYRSTPRNMGVAPWNIGPQVRILLDDARFWIANGTFGADECALRFHHRLVAIHPFANGNGRHSRMMADLIAHSRGAKRFSWGSADLSAASSVRRRYIESLHSADGHDYGLLIAFGRS
jgi:Fic-DOC domain mobile mystery protein B